MSSHRVARPVLFRDAENVVLLATAVFASGCVRGAKCLPGAALPPPHPASFRRSLGRGSVPSLFISSSHLHIPRHPAMDEDL